VLRSRSGCRTENRCLLAVIEESDDERGERVDRRVRGEATGAAVIDHVGDRAHRHRHHRATRHQGLDEYAGDALVVARQEEHVDAGEHGNDIGERAEAMDRPGDIRRVGGPVDAFAPRAVTADDQACIGYRGPDSREYFDGAVGPFLCGEVPDPPDQRSVVGYPEFVAQCASGRRAVDGREALGVARVGDRPDRPREPESPDLADEGLADAGDGIDPTDDEAPPLVTRSAPQRGREPEYALPDEARIPIAAREHGGLDRATAVREHDVDGAVPQLAPEGPRRGEEGEGPASGPSGEGRESRFAVPVEGGSESYHPVLGAAPVEEVGELEGHDLGPASLAPRHDVENAHARRFTVGAVGRGAILVLPTVAAGQQGPVAAWVSTAGWADALARSLGESWIVTPEGVVPAERARARASLPALAPPGSGRGRRVPTVVKTAVKDARDLRRARRFRVAPAGPWSDSEVAFVWQRHELFHTAGIELAAALTVPAVVFVPAPLVWQARQWGVRRPGWARVAEYAGEARPLRRADLVACGTEAVAEQVARMGVPESRVVVTPTGADPVVLDAPARATARTATRSRFGLGDAFVVGWIGSFRAFHALDLVVDAVAGVPGSVLVLVGDGPERARVETRARSLGVSVVATGTVPHDALPAMLAGLDAAVIAADGGSAFHYSPLKLAEYLAAGLAVVAPAVGEPGARLRTGEDALLVPPGDPTAIAEALRRLRDDPSLRERIGEQARAVARTEWSWDRSAERVLGALGGR